MCVKQKPLTNQFDEPSYWVLRMHSLRVLSLVPLSHFLLRFYYYSITNSVALFSLFLLSLILFATFDSVFIYIPLHWGFSCNSSTSIGPMTDSWKLFFKIKCLPSVNCSPSTYKSLIRNMISLAWLALQLGSSQLHLQSLFLFFPCQWNKFALHGALWPALALILRAACLDCDSLTLFAASFYLWYDDWSFASTCVWPEHNQDRRVLVHFLRYTFHSLIRYTYVSPSITSTFYANHQAWPFHR